MNQFWERHVPLLLLIASIAALSECGSPEDFGTGAPRITDNPDRAGFTLASGGAVAPIYVSGADYVGVHRVADLLRQDLENVVGVGPEVIVEDVPSSTSVAVVVGTIGRSPLIDWLVEQQKLDITDVEGRWETFVIEVVPEPFPGVDKALVIAGSDKRGTIYGMFELSRMIGVSPWYWWADVPIRRRPELFLSPGRHSLGEPKVKYRGIFINDEAPALSGWVHENYGSFNHEFYEKVFELILRMRGNYLWPAMWGRAIYDDDPVSPVLADEYGIVIGASHHEPMMRAHVEWDRYGEGPWNFEENEEQLRSFWREGIERMGSNESIVTVGMRGDGDKPMSAEANIALLERIVATQREIMEDVTGRPASEQPQIWALYKEVQEYYDRGMRVPEDITILLADDNWGNIRKLPDPDEPPRSGGYGVYYHFDYVGDPRNYKWLNTNQIARVWEQMNLAYEREATQIWIVNVGDIKPTEFPTEFFLDFAWNPEAWPSESLPEYARRWAEEQFGSKHAPAIADILTAYTKFNSRRKPELLSTETYSLQHYHEAETVATDYSELAERAVTIGGLLAPEFRDAYHQLVLFPVQACANLNEMYLAAARNALYAKQGRLTTNRMADRVGELFERDAELTRQFHEDVAGGKWNHMMSQTHIGYTYWQEPPENKPPDVVTLENTGRGQMSVAIDGSELFWPGAEVEPVLPEADPYLKQSYYIDVFNRGRGPFEIEVTSSEAWLNVSPQGALIDDEVRITTTIDWTRAPAGRHEVRITITGPGGRSITVMEPVRNPKYPAHDEVDGFMESNGHISIEAEHFSRAVERGDSGWERVPDLGRTLSGMMPVPVTSRRLEPGGNSPRLEYRINLFEAGDVDIHVYTSPSIDFNDGGGLKYGVSIDDAELQIVNLHADPSHRAWARSVSENIIKTVSTHHIDTPGKHVLKYWQVDAGVVLQKIVVDAGGLKPSYLGPPESYFRLR